MCACVNASRPYYEAHSSHLLLGAEGHLFSTQNFYLTTHTGSNSQALCDKFPSPQPIRKQPFKQRSQEHFLSVGRLTAKRMIDRPLVRDDSQIFELCGSPQARLLPCSPFICMNERFLINKRANEFESEGSQQGKGTFSRMWRCVNCRNPTRGISRQPFFTHTLTASEQQRKPTTILLKTGSVPYAQIQQISNEYDNYI